MTDEPTRNPCELAAPAAVPPGYVPVNELADLRERAGFNDGWIVWPPCSVDQVAAAVARERELHKQAQTELAWYRSRTRTISRPGHAPIEWYIDGQTVGWGETVDAAIANRIMRDRNSH